METGGTQLDLGKLPLARPVVLVRGSRGHGTFEDKHVRRRGCRFQPGVDPLQKLKVSMILAKRRCAWVWLPTEEQFQPLEHQWADQRRRARSDREIEQASEENERLWLRLDLPR